MMHPAFRATAQQPRPADVALARRDWAGLHVLGPGAEAWLKEHDWPIPSQPLTLLEGQGTVITRIGEAEFIVGAGAADALPGPPAAERTPRVWAFPRFDAVFELSGADWLQVLTQLCHYDFRTLASGNWLPVALAGINVWCLRSPHGIWIGCDPSYGDDLEATLRTVVDGLANGTANPS